MKTLFINVSHNLHVLPQDKRGTGKSRNKETRNETKRHFKVERSWRSCACAPSLMVLPDRKGSEYPRSLFSCRLMPQGKGGGGGA